MEGVNGETARAGLLGTFFDWGLDEPTVAITDITPTNDGNLITFQANRDSNVSATWGWQFRWDFDNGTDVAGPFGYSQVGHVYEESGVYTITVEVTDSFGNTAIGSLEGVEVTIPEEIVIPGKVVRP